MSTMNFPRPRDWNRLVAAVRDAEAAIAAAPWADAPGVYAEAHERLTAARATLRAAFDSAPWGRNGSVFITDQADGIASSTRTRTLHVQGRAVATCGDNGWVRLVDPAQAEAEFAGARKRNREYDSAYKAEREMLIEQLVAAGLDEPASFGGWTFVDGQEGGCFYRASGQKATMYVAAERAVASAKLRPEGISDSLADGEDEFGGRRPVRTRHF